MNTHTGETLPFRTKPILHRDSTNDLLQRLKSGRYTNAALLLEGRGGMGKTFFLNQLQSILALPPGHPPAPGTPLLVGAIDEHHRSQRVMPLDMIYADAALPRTIEQMLLTCVRRSGYAQHHFAAYEQALHDYQLQRQHLSFADLKTREAAVRERFFDGWEALAAETQALLVVSFDTCEYLERIRISHLPKIAESEDVWHEKLGVRDQFFNWLHQAIQVRKLKQTLFIFCGRGVVGGSLFAHLNTISAGRIEVFDLEELAASAFAAYLAPVAPADLAADLGSLAHFLCDGSPLKLDLLYELLSTDREWCRRQLFAPEVSPGEARIRFYHEALHRFFDPASYLDDESRSAEAQANGLCLVCLAYARCGASLSDLQAFVATYGITPPSDTQLRRYLEGDGTIKGHSLVKKLTPRIDDDHPDGDERVRRQPQYFLHDQLWVDIDTLFRDTGINTVVWRLLAERRLAAIQLCDAESQWRRRVELMCEHLIVAMLHDPVESYRYYTSYVDQALRLRDVDGAVVLSETFWRTIYYETSSVHGRFFPVLSSLIGSRAINPEYIARDELVRQLRILAALSRPVEAGEPTAQFDQAAADDSRAELALEQARRIAAELQAAMAEQPDPYLEATLTLGIVDVWLTYDPYRADTRNYLQDLITMLERAAQDHVTTPQMHWRNAHQPLLLQRLPLLLARAYRYRAELNEELLHFSDAATYSEQSLAALARYRSLDREGIDIATEREQRLAEVCLANSYARTGRRADARRIAEQLEQALDPQGAMAHRLSRYDRVLLLSRYAMAFPDNPISEAFSLEALQLARAIAVKQALDIASLARLIVLRRRIVHTQHTHTPDEMQRYERQLDALLLGVIHGERPTVARDLRYDIVHEVARTFRSRFAHRYQDTGAYDMPLTLLQEAYRLINDSGVEQELHHAIADDSRKQWYRLVQYADLIETKVSLFSALLMTLHRRAIERGQAYADEQTIMRHLPRLAALSDKRPITLDHLGRMLDAIEEMLIDTLLEQPGPQCLQDEPRQRDPFILVVLGRIALQRGLLMLYGRPNSVQPEAAMPQLTLALAFAARFSAEPNPIYERDVFLSLIQRVLNGSNHPIRTHVATYLAACLPSEPPHVLIIRPDIGRGDPPAAAWQSACSLIRRVLDERHVP